MIGQRYAGGGGGDGRFHSSKEIYFQESNGSNNYHEMPTGLESLYDRAIKAMAPEIFKKIEEYLIKDVEDNRASDIVCLNRQIKALEEIGKESN
jgi:hypothetical protein